MITTFEPSPFDLARLYDRERPPFRITPKTLLAVSVVASLHLGIGLIIARAYFALPVEDGSDVAINATIFRPPPPKPVTPPPVSRPPPTEAKTPPIDRHDPPIDLPTGTEFSSVPSVPQVPDPPRTPDPPAHAESTPPPLPPPVITNPNWLSRPTADQVGRLYPARAMNEDKGGRAVLLCEVLASGDVSNCSLLEETPKGYRFGEAAQAMTRYFKLSPRSVDGVSVAGSKVRIPIVFSPS